VISRVIQQWIWTYIIYPQEPDLNKPCHRSGKLVLEHLMEAILSKEDAPVLDYWDIWIAPLLNCGASLHLLAGKPILGRFLAGVPSVPDLMALWTYVRAVQWPPWQSWTGKSRNEYLK